MHDENQMHHSSHHPIYHKLQPERSQSHKTDLYAVQLNDSKEETQSSNGIMALKFGNLLRVQEIYLFAYSPISS